MATNEYLPVATGAGSAVNLETQAAYLADASRQNGQVSGLASRLIFNKMWRQPSVVSSMIAQFIVDTLAVDCLDDGDIAALEAKFILALQSAVGVRTPLVANTNFYVATTGNDANSGLDAGHPWLTWQHAWTTIQGKYDLAGHVATVNIADGAYTASLLASGTVVGQVGGVAGIVFSGNNATPANVNNTVANAPAVKVSDTAALTIQGMKLIASGSGTGLECTSGGHVNTGPMEYGACGFAQINSHDGGYISETGSAKTISGGSTFHADCFSNSTLILNGATTLTGTPAFSGAFVQGNLLGLISASLFSVASGTATGVRYISAANAAIYTNGGGASFFPGNSAGSTSNGGIYI